MATVIEGPYWTVTEEAAEVLVADGILVICGDEHVDTLDVDKPIYHISHNAPPEVGRTTIHSYIVEAERRVEEKSTGVKGFD